MMPKLNPVSFQPHKGDSSMYIYTNLITTYLIYRGGILSKERSQKNKEKREENTLNTKKK